jgi:enterobactin synthetase component D / holo-[acyl-carrier protein] synthase
MIESIVPPGVAVQETTVPLAGAQLFPEEERVVAAAVQERREEFATARECARRALAALGVAPQAIGSGTHGQPVWPTGIVGSITHCAGYRGCAVAHGSDVQAIGIDAEPHVALPEGLERAIAVADERSMIGQLGTSAPDVKWDRVLFSAKEATFKAWFPGGGRLLGFEDAAVRLDPVTQTFDAAFVGSGNTARLLGMEGLAGRWLVRNGLILTAVTRRARA